jgi:AraC-like DNA-binding protein
MINTFDFQLEHPTEFAQLTVKEMLFLYYKCPQIDKKIYLYTHFNKIFFVLDGKKTFHQRNKSWEMTTGKSFMIKKSAYGQEMFAKFEWEVVCFYMPDSFLKNFFDEHRTQLLLKAICPPSADGLIEIDVTESTRAFFYSVIPYFKQKIPPSADLLELKFKELLMHILLNPANRELLSYVYHLSESNKPQISDIMEANYTFNLSLAEFARISQRSLASFKREFILQYQTTPGKWLTSKRLEYAVHLLQTSKKSITEITDECGFENGTHFSRIFKQTYQLSPLQYRKKMNSRESLLTF